jgi:hypothetical protein
MKSLTQIIGLTATIITLNSCSKYEIVEKQQPKTEQLVGIPLSVTSIYARHNGNLATVLKIEDKTILAHAYLSNTQTAAQATALIESEINDNNSEPIILHGQYNNGAFEIYKLTANNYSIKFR